VLEQSRVAAGTWQVGTPLVLPAWVLALLLFTGRVWAAPH
jgi:hypothetical protein